jgi:hypothetical protein
MVQLAAKIRERLDVARFRPQRASDPLTRNRAGARVKDEERDQLLLSSTWHADSRTAVLENAEPSEQLDAQRGPNSHIPRLHAIMNIQSHAFHWASAS